MRKGSLGSARSAYSEGSAPESKGGWDVMRWGFAAKKPPTSPICTGRCTKSSMTPCKKKGGWVKPDNLGWWHNNLPIFPNTKPSTSVAPVSQLLQQPLGANEHGHLCLSLGGRFHDASLCHAHHGTCAQPPACSRQPGSWHSVCMAGTGNLHFDLEESNFGDLLGMPQQPPVWFGFWRLNPRFVANDGKKEDCAKWLAGFLQNWPLPAAPSSRAQGIVRDLQQC